MNMTSRERVIRTIEGKSVDRAPIDFGGYQSGIVDVENIGNGEPPYGIRALYEYLGINDYEEVVTSHFKQAANIDERLLKRFGCDIRHVDMGAYPLEPLPDGRLRTMWGIILTPTGLYNQIIDSETPLRHVKTVKEIEEYAYWPDPKDPVFLNGLIENAKSIFQTTDCAISLSAGYPTRIFHMYSWLRGFDYWLMDMHSNHDIYFALSKKISEIGLAVLNEVLPAVGKYIDIVEYNDDMGMQTQPLMSLDMYRKYVKPWTKMFVNEIKHILPHVKVFNHSCGSVFDLIPDFIDCGFDIINPIQPLAYKMEPWRLKKAYGDRICLHGGIDIQRLLNFGNPEEINKSVKETLSILEDCRFIMAPSHNIEPETPPENIVAMFDAALEYANEK